MNIKKCVKRSIMSLLLILATAVSLFSFASCGASSTEEEEQTIKVHVKIVGLNNEILSDLDVEVIAAPSDMTVLTATKRACEIESIECVYNEDDRRITKIGQYQEASSSDTAEEDTGEGDEEVTETETTVATTGLFWYLVVNDVESSSGAKISDGDRIVWSYVDLAITDE